MLSSLGGVFGWWIARWCVLVYALAERGPGLSSWRILDYTMDYRVLGYLFAISVGTGLLFGLAPALGSRGSTSTRLLKDGGRSAPVEGAASMFRPSRDCEIALAVVLLAGAGVMIRSFLNIYNADLGVDTANILTAPCRPAGRGIPALSRRSVSTTVSTARVAGDRRRGIVRAGQPASNFWLRPASIPARGRSARRREEPPNDFRSRAVSPSYTLEHSERGSAPAASSRDDGP